MKDVFKFSGLALVLAIGLVVSSAVVSKFFLRVRQEKCIVVKGTAQADVSADVGVFGCGVSVRAASQTNGFAVVKQQSMMVLEKLAELGVVPACIEEEGFAASTVFKRDAEGRLTSEADGFEVSWRAEVSSTDVELVKRAARELAGLLRYGVLVEVSGPRFFVSDLDAVKKDLLKAATADGLERARILAANGQGKVGELTAARQGVFQITKRNSSETDDYGVYDTSAIEKTVRAVVTLEYAVGK